MPGLCLPVAPRQDTPLPACVKAGSAPRGPLGLVSFWRVYSSHTMAQGHICCAGKAGHIFQRRGKQWMNELYREWDQQKGQKEARAISAPLPPAGQQKAQLASCRLSLLSNHLAAGFLHSFPSPFFLGFDTCDYYQSWWR